MSSGSLIKQLEEIHLLQCSLLPGELFAFVLPADDLLEWSELLQIYAETSEIPDRQPSSACRFEVKIQDAPLFFEVELPRDYPEHSQPMVYVRGQDIDRSEQEKWQMIVREKQAELRGSEPDFLIHNLLCLCLIPLLHEHAPSLSQQTAQVDPLSATDEGEQPADPVYHALFTSHHLISPTKRRNLQKWASELSLHGFAKVGYPGCIYSEGARANVKEFVTRVKAMQWLALRVRFEEPLGIDLGRLADRAGSYHAEKRWVEFEKVGEVVEYMRHVGRGDFVTEMGLGSASN